MSGVVRTIDLNAAGPAEDLWLAMCGALDRFIWPRCRRVVVVSPHPDDESLGAGGLVATAASAGCQVVIIFVTDGEAADPDRRDLAAIRRLESVAATRCLDPSGSIKVVRLGLADGAVRDAAQLLESRLEGVLEPGDLVIAPIPDDGHPDHTATSTAASAAAAHVGADVLWFPVWAWHCHDPADSSLRRGVRLDLDPAALARKVKAIGCYQSQTTGAAPVVPEHMVDRLSRPFEVFVRPS